MFATEIQYTIDIPQPYRPLLSSSMMDSQFAVSRRTILVNILCSKTIWPRKLKICWPWQYNVMLLIMFQVSGCAFMYVYLIYLASHPSDIHTYLREYKGRFYYCYNCYNCYGFCTQHSVGSSLLTQPVHPFREFNFPFQLFH